MAADESGGGGADARLSVQHIVQRPPALRVWRLQVWCCKSVWRQVWQVWRQVWRCCCEISLCCLQVLLFSSCMASNKNNNIIELQFSVYIFYISAADTGLALVDRDLIKVLHFDYSKFLLSLERDLIKVLPFNYSKFLLSQLRN